MDAVFLCDLGGSAADIRMDAGVDGVDRGDRGASEGAIAGIADDEEEMTMCTSAKGAVDGTGIFEDLFFKNGESGMVGFAFGGAIKGGEGAVGKGACDVAHGGDVVGYCNKGRRMLRRSFEFEKETCVGTGVGGWAGGRRSGRTRILRTGC